MSDTPIDLLASRVWSGSKWHYPHIEAMLAERELLRAEVASMQKQRDEARRWLREACAEIARTRLGFYDTLTPQQIAEQNGWNCFAQEGGGA